MPRDAYFPRRDLPLTPPVRLQIWQSNAIKASRESRRVREGKQRGQAVSEHRLVRKRRPWSASAAASAYLHLAAAAHYMAEAGDIEMGHGGHDSSRQSGAQRTRRRAGARRRRRRDGAQRHQRRHGSSFCCFLVWGLSPALRVHLSRWGLSYERSFFDLKGICPHIMDHKIHTKIHA